MVINNNYYQYLDNYIYEKRASGLSEKTLFSYEFAIRKFLDYLNGQELTKQNFISFLNSKSIKGVSKQHYNATIRVFLYYLMNEGVIPKFNVANIKYQEPMPKIPTREEVKRLLVKHGNDFLEDRMYAIVNLVISTGIRARNIINLKVDDIDIKDCTLTLRATKNKRVNIIPLSQDLIIILNRYIKKYGLNDWLFPNKKGKQLQYDGLSCAYNRYAKKRNLQYTNIHSLRHFFATECVRNGMSTFTLMRILGHSDIQITMRYVNLVSEDIRNEAVKYNPLVNMEK